MEKKASLLSGGRGLAVCVLLLALAGFMTYRTLTTAPPPVPEPIETIFMCSEKHMTFPYAMRAGESWPVVSPFTNQRTGYPVEHCYWTKDGKRKATPTYVILNEHLGKPGDTICPDCGRVVIGHNPPPPPGTPLAEPGSATQQTPPPGTAKPATSPGKTPVTPARPASPPERKPSAAPPASQPAKASGTMSPGKNPASPENAAVAEKEVYAYIRAKMDQMIQQRAKLLSSGKTSADPEVQQLETSILNARQLLTEKGEVVGEIVPPLAPPAEPSK
jgi:hypothetical protein